MFNVRWKRSARDELANLWLQADSAMRHALTAATHQLDQKLRSDPISASESRGADDRVQFEFPLGVSFEIDQQRSEVRILHTWSFRRRR
jgi:hypothetical protein